MEPVLAEAVRPVANAIAAAQAEADVANHPDRFSSQRQVADAMERLQPRGDLPAVPSLAPGGDPDIWRLEPVEVLPDSGPTPTEQVAAVAEQLTARLPDLPATEDPVLARLRAWPPER